jgi:hypothetical protein
MEQGDESIVAHSLSARQAARDIAFRAQRRSNPGQLGNRPDRLHALLQPAALTWVKTADEILERLAS